MELPGTKYAKTVDGVNIAYQVRGEAPVDLVCLVGFASNFELKDVPDRWHLYRVVA